MKKLFSTKTILFLLAMLVSASFAQYEEYSGGDMNDGSGEYSEEPRFSVNVLTDAEKKEVAREKEELKKIKHGPHAALLGGFPLMDGQPGYRGMNKINSLIEGETGYKVAYKFPYVWLVMGLNLGMTYINFTSSDEKQHYSYVYLGIPVSARYPFTELFYVSGGLTYKRMLNFVSSSYSEYIAMDGNVFLFSASVGVMLGRWDLGIVLGTEYLGDEKSNRGENFRNRFLNIGINAECWF